MGSLSMICGRELSMGCHFQTQSIKVFFVLENDSSPIVIDSIRPLNLFLDLGLRLLYLQQKVFI